MFLFLELFLDEHGMVLRYLIGMWFGMQYGEDQRSKIIKTHV